MKRIVFFILAFSVLTSVVFAEELDDQNYYSMAAIEDNVSDPDDEVPIELEFVDPADLNQGSVTNVIYTGSDLSDAVITDISLMSLSPVEPSDTSGLKAVLLSVIGPYDPVIIEYQYENNNGYTSYLREVQPDYVWQGSLLLFGLIIYCIFRLGGALIRD